MHAASYSNLFHPRKKSSALLHFKMRGFGVCVFIATACALGPLRRVVNDYSRKHTPSITAVHAAPSAAVADSSSRSKRDEGMWPGDFNITDFEQTFVHSTKPDDWKSYPVECGHKFTNYVTKGYYEARDRFKKHGGRPNMKAGPNACQQISCSEATAVKLCNDASPSISPKAPCTSYSAESPKNASYHTSLTKRQVPFADVCALLEFRAKVLGFVEAHSGRPRGDTR